LTRAGFLTRRSTPLDCNCKRTAEITILLLHHISGVYFFFSFRFLLTPVLDPFNICMRKKTNGAERKTDVLSGVYIDGVRSLSFSFLLYIFSFHFSSFGACGSDQYLHEEEKIVQRGRRVRHEPRICLDS
jgi:hypothetical protein